MTRSHTISKGEIMRGLHFKTNAFACRDLIQEALHLHQSVREEDSSFLSTLSSSSSWDASLDFFSLRVGEDKAGVPWEEDDEEKTSRLARRQRCPAKW